MFINNKILIGLILLIGLFAISIGLFYFFGDEFIKKPESKEIAEQKEEQGITHGSCLEDDEVASYEIKEQKTRGGEGIAIVTIKDKKSQKENFSFQLDVLRVKHYHPIELHKCGVYATKSFNYDYTARKPLAGYRAEIWKYNYGGGGEKIILLDENISENLVEYKHFFSSDFRVSPNERYIVLEKGYLGQDDYALVVKDLSTKEDLLVLTLKEILEKYSDIIPGSFDLGKWTDDNKYFWGTLSQGALDIAYYRIKAGTWETEIYSKPSDIVAGVERSTNINKLYLAYADIPTFTGIQEITDQIIKEAKEKGQQKNLYVYNFITKGKTKIASTDPDKKFNIKWISDTKLEYELPSGEKKVYEIQ